MKKAICLLLITIFFGSAQAQLTVPAHGNSVKAIVGERIGLTDVTINYGRPGVKGREGKVWGGLVYEGFKNLGFGNGKECPWRAGANENTTIEFSTDVTIEGKHLAAGKYGFFVAYHPDKCTIIFSSATESWGSYFYDEKEDVLRVNVTPTKLQEMRERLTYQFADQTDSTATIKLEWEHLAIPFKVGTKLHQLQMASFEREMKGEKGFDSHALVQVADYLLEHDTKLEDALTYINAASSGLPVYRVFMVKSVILEKLGKSAEADSIRQVAIDMGSERQIHFYARGLQQEQKMQEAFEAFRYNYKKHPNTYTTTMGMARGYSGIGKLKDAKKYAHKALALAPDEANKKSVQAAIATLESGKQLE